MLSVISNSNKILSVRLLLVLIALLSPLAYSQNMPLVVELAKTEDWGSLRNLLLDGVNPNVVYGDGTAALHWASYHDDIAAVQILLDAQADINVTTDLGVTPLWLAAENGSTAMADLLLSAGADPNRKLLAGESIVMTAAQSGNGDVVRALLAAGADPNGAVTREQTALMWAAGRGHGEAVAALIEYGADIHARSEISEHYVKSEKEQDSNDIYKHWVELGGNNALMFAARAGNLTSAAHLINAGAEVDSINAFGFSPLVLAVHSGNSALVDLLIASSANIDDDRGGHTALHAAVLRGDQQSVNALISAGANLEAEVERPTPTRRQSTDYNFHDALIGATPLWLAARFAEPQMMQALIDAGANMFATNNVVYPAQRLGENFIVDEGEISLLMAALGMGHRRLRISWWTPERRAGQLGRDREQFILEAAKVAVRAGVDVSLENAEGQSALAFAKDRRYESVVAFLESNALNP